MISNTKAERREVARDACQATENDSDLDQTAMPIIDLDPHTMDVEGDCVTDLLCDDCDLLQLLERMKGEALRSGCIFDTSQQIIQVLVGKYPDSKQVDYRKRHHDIAMGTVNAWLKKRRVKGPGWLSIMCGYTAYIDAALMQFKKLADFINSEESESDCDESATMDGIRGFTMEIHDTAVRSVDVAECAADAYYRLYGGKSEERTEFEHEPDGELRCLREDIDVIHESISYIVTLLDALMSDRVVCGDPAA